MTTDYLEKPKEVQVETLCLENATLDTRDFKIILSERDVIVISAFGSVIFSFAKNVTWQQIAKMDEFYLRRKVVSTSFELYELDKNAIDGVILSNQFTFNHLPENFVELLMSTNSYSEFEALVKNEDKKSSFAYAEEYDFILSNFKIVNEKFTIIARVLRNAAKEKVSEMSFV